MGRFDRSEGRGDSVTPGTQNARRLARAQRHMQEGDISGALMLFGEIISGGDPDHRQAACVGAGNAYLAGQRYDLAETAFENALEAGPDGELFAEALQNLGIVRYVRGDRAGACSVMQDLAMLDHPVFSPLATDNLQVLYGMSLY